MEDFKMEEVEFELVGEFLLGLKKEFGRGDKEIVKVAKLKRVKQERRIIEEFVQKFRRAVRGDKYEKRALVERLKRGISGAIIRKLIETERPPISIKQWYKHATNLDRY